VTSDATANAGADQSICYTATAIMAGSIGGGATSSTWSTNGDGAFDNTSLLNAVYSPGPSDITSGTVTFTLTTNDPAGPCVATSDSMVLTVSTNIPVLPAFPTGPTTACTGNQFTYTIPPVSNATSYTWASLDGNATIVSGQGGLSVSILFGTL